MNLSPLVSRYFQDCARGLLGWSLAMVVICLLYLPLYPSMKQSDLLSAKLEALPPEMLDGFGLDALTMSNPAGYTEQTVFSMLGLLIMLIAAIGLGARSIAGAEESGALELTLAHAAGRRTVVLSRVLVLILFIATMALCTALAVALLNGPSQLELSGLGILAAAAGLGMIALLHGMLALALGAATGRRGLALAVASSVAVLGYLARNLGGRIADWIPDLSPFEWGLGSHPLQTGFDWTGLGGLGAGALLLAVIAVVTFERRDLRAA
ncbi:ABC transporter permease subunit [Gephyromycinifex aptenodytis]|uniref:ABC transporter permease subunit n=1 Tax=Gephyromycinifex aptenodytis TaxID=2716227 RepID=UPI0014471FD9|nr:ABC transporter permease subunit [Gephyromycinifex aptenodytis]